MMRITQHTNPTRLHHQVQVKVQGITQPALSKTSGKVAVGDNDNVGGGLAVHICALDDADAADEVVDAGGDLGGGLAVDAAVAPDVPGLLGGVEAVV